MSVLVFIVPLALVLGSIGLFAFMWAMRNDQFDDPEGAAMRILIDDDDISQDPQDKADKSSSV